MDQVGRFVADAVLGIDTIWGGDVMCPSGTGRFIADSWYSDEPLPAAYTVASAARVRETGGVAGKTVDRDAVEAYLRDVNLPAAIAGVRHEAGNLPGLRGQYLIGLANCLEVMWDSGDGDPRQRSGCSLHALRRGLDGPRARAVQAGSQARSRGRAAESRRLLDHRQWRSAGRGGRVASRPGFADGFGQGAGCCRHRLLRQPERGASAAATCRRSWHPCHAPTSTSCPSRTPGSPAR